MTKRVLFINIRSHKIERLEPLFSAKRLGYEVVLLCDVKPDIDESLISKIIVADTYNTAACVKIVKEFHKKDPLSGVLTWADKDVPLVSLIGKELSLPALPYSSSSSVRNKFEMRKNIAKSHPELCPKFQSVKSYTDLTKAHNEIGVPAIFKPIGASGSKGIFKIDTKTDLSVIYQKMEESSSQLKDKIFSYFPNQFIYEEYLFGDEISVEGIVQNGKTIIAGITDKEITDEYSLEYREIFPSKYYEASYEIIKDSIKKVISALKIDNCPFHAECKFDEKNGVLKIIEIAGRPGGGFITSHLIPLASGISFHEQVIKMAMGEEIDKTLNIEKWYEKKAGYSGHLDCFSTKEGTLKAIDGLDTVFEDPKVVITIPTAQIGSLISLPPKSFTSLFVTTSVVKGNTYEEVDQTLEKIQQKISIRIEK